MKQLSRHAHAAKLIRQEIKAALPGLKYKVKAKCFAGGSAVDVYLEDQPPTVEQAVKSIVAKYKYGSFDGMYDIYEYINIRNDIPQVKYASVNNRLSAMLQDRIERYITSHYSPDSFRNFNDVQSMAWRMFKDGSYLEIPHIQDNA